MTRVWLTGWEWDCCGDPFVVGDAVDFGIAHRRADEWLASVLGAQLSATLDAVESHHEEDFADRVRGVVTAVHAVSLEHVERRELRRPGHGAPPDAMAPSAGEEWPPALMSPGGGSTWASRPSRYMVVSEPVPESASLHPVLGVRVAASDDGGRHRGPGVPTRPAPRATRAGAGGMARRGGRGLTTARRVRSR